MIYWALGFVTSITSFAVYLEFASYFSNRSGSEVVYLEQAYPRPRWLFPTAFAFQTIVLSFSSGNSIGNCDPLVTLSWIPTENCHSARGIFVRDERIYIYCVAAEGSRSRWIHNCHTV